MRSGNVPGIDPGNVPERMSVVLARARSATSSMPNRDFGRSADRRPTWRPGLRAGNLSFLGHAEHGELRRGSAGVGADPPEPEPGQQQGEPEEHRQLDP